MLAPSGAEGESLDRGHSAPPLRRPPKLEMRSRRKDLFFQQIPDCNLAPQSGPYGRTEEKSREATGSVESAENSRSLAGCHLVNQEGKTPIYADDIVFSQLGSKSAWRRDLINHQNF